MGLERPAAGARDSSNNDALFRRINNGDVCDNIQGSTPIYLQIKLDTDTATLIWVRADILNVYSGVAASSFDCIQGFKLLRDLGTLARSDVNYGLIIDHTTPVEVFPAGYGRKDLSGQVQRLDSLNI
jgi:hypothetical protein